MQPMQPFAFPMEMMGVMAPPQRKRNPVPQMLAPSKPVPKPGGNKVDKVNVMCNNVKGTFMISSQTIVCRCISCTENGEAGSRPMSPTEFERHSGMQTSKKWRRSIKVDMGPSHKDTNKSIGRWLEENGYLPPAPPPMTQPIIVPGANGMPMMIVPGVMGSMQAAAFMQQQMAAAAAMSGYPGAQMFPPPGAMMFPPAAKPSKKKAAGGLPTGDADHPHMDHEEALLAADALNLLKRNEVSSDEAADEWAPQHPVMPQHPMMPPGMMPPMQLSAAHAVPDKASLRSLVSAHLSRAPPVGGLKTSTPAGDTDSKAAGGGDGAKEGGDGPDLSANLLSDHGHRGSNSHRVGNQRPESAWAFPAKQGGWPGTGASEDGSAPPGGEGEAAAPASEAGDQDMAAGGEGAQPGTTDSKALVVAGDGQAEGAEGDAAEAKPVGEGEGDAAAVVTDGVGEQAAGEAGTAGNGAVVVAAGEGGEGGKVGKEPGSAKKRKKKPITHIAGIHAMPGMFPPHMAAMMGIMPGFMPPGMVPPGQAGQPAGMMMMPAMMAAGAGMPAGFPMYGAPGVAPPAKKPRPPKPRMPSVQNISAAAGTGPSQFGDDDMGGHGGGDVAAGGKAYGDAPPPMRRASPNQMAYFPAVIHRSHFKNELPVSKEAAPRVVRPRTSRMHKFSYMPVSGQVDDDMQEDQEGGMNGMGGAGLSRGASMSGGVDLDGVGEVEGDEVVPLGGEGAEWDQMAGGEQGDVMEEGQAGAGGDGDVQGYTEEDVAEAAAALQQSWKTGDGDPESVPRKHNGMAGTRKMRKPANKRLVKLALQPMLVSDVQELDNGNLGVRVFCPYGEFSGNVEEMGAHNRL